MSVIFIIRQAQSMKSPGTTGSAHIHEHLMFKGTRLMGVTDFAADEALNRQIDELMSKIYREKYWKKMVIRPELLSGRSRSMN